MSFQEYSESLTSRLHMGKAKTAAIVGICILVFIVAVIVMTSIAFKGGEFEVSKADASDIQVEEAQDGVLHEDAAASEICVDVAGCVKSPGICCLKEGSRVADAIAAVGGFSEEAATSSVNQARVLADGEQLYVPSLNDAANAVASVAGGGDAAPSATDASGKVNINIADSSQLQTLSGIGQSKADKIVAYRDSNGPFSSVDDLTNVSGIGDKTLEAIRDSICV